MGPKGITRRLDSKSRREKEEKEHGGLRAAVGDDVKGRGREGKAKIPGHSSPEGRVLVTTFPTKPSLRVACNLATKLHSQCSFVILSD